ncbi:MAG: DUF3343 domain-containing protein [Bacilli bacterium]
MDDYYLLSFVNAHSAMKAQTLLDNRIAFLVIPTPMSISGSCGISLKIAPRDWPELLKAAQSGLLDSCDPRYWAAQGSGPFAEYDRVDINGEEK